MNTLNLLDFVETPAFAMVFAGDEAPNIVFWNARAEAFTGLKRAEVLGKSPTFVMGSLAAPLLSSDWWDNPGQVMIEGFGIVKLVGLPDAKTVVGTVVSAMRRTDDDEREMFLGMATHDVRAPLRNIAHLCEELLVDYPDPGDGRNRLVRTIRAVSDRTLAMTEEILTAVQADSLQYAPSSAVDLQPLCDLVFATLDPTGRHGLRSDPASLIVERPVLQIVLRNLVDNAIRHGASESALNIHVSVAEAEPGRLSVSVADDGHGFTDLSLKSLSGNDVRYDSGFGLYGIRRLLRARGGGVTAAAGAGGKGSVVTVTLPGRLRRKAPEIAHAS
ncbi:MAG: PAS domain-containing sensor histidine kinase [Silicimonas sp.]|nr:PAS domain-containing sensor histidine kinase [Silicimonas sp.]